METNQLNSEKLNQATATLRRLGVDLWLILARETDVMADPMLDYVAPFHVSAPAAYLITPSGERIAIVGNIDIAGARSSGLYTKLVPYLESFRETLLALIEEINPASIAINFSDSVPTADGLTTGMYLKLLDTLKGTRFENCLMSAEPVITKLRGCKSDAELVYMRKAIELALQIFSEVGSKIKPGKSEQDIADYVAGMLAERSLTPAWAASGCPMVFTGPEAVDPHALPTQRRIEPGFMVNMDFGIKYEGYCSDLQRSWYVLKPGEQSAPELVQQGFTILLGAIDAVAGGLKPGVLGVDMDRLAREHLQKHGYRPYKHGTGHQVGRQVHDGGALICPAWERYGDSVYLPLEAGQVFTIEPRLWIAGHGTVTIEEEVLLTEHGCEFLSGRQTELWLIG